MATVAELIAEQKKSVDDLQDQAIDLLNDLIERTADVEFGDTPFNVNGLLPKEYNWDSVASINFPIYNAGGGVSPSSVPAAPSPPAFDTGSVSEIFPREYTGGSPPQPDTSGMPDPAQAAPTDSAPDPQYPVQPNAPHLVSPVLPAFSAIVIPPPPSIDLPAFAGVLPNDDLLTPTATFSYFEAAYSSTLLDPLKAKLLDNLVNGGYGIETNDEVALFNRARDREVEAMLSRVDDAGRAMAARGFPLPPGELSIHVDRAYQDMQDKVSSVSRDITLERAKLFVENRQFTIDQVKGLEQILIGFHNSVQERALNVSRTMVELSIAVYNTLLSRFQARVELYKAQATAFAERIRGELAKAEVYRTEVEAAGIGVGIQRNQVEIYVAQFRANESAVAVYKAQVDAANALVALEKEKLEIFKLKVVDVYTAETQAKIAEFGAYNAKINGEKAKVDAYDAQVREYTAEIGGQKALIDARIGNITAKEAKVRAQLAQYQAEVTQYDATIRNQLEGPRLILESDRVRQQGYNSWNEGFFRQAQLQEQAREAAVRHNIMISQNVIENAKVQLQAAVEALKNKREVGEFSSDKFFTLLNTLASGLNTLAVQEKQE